MDLLKIAIKYKIQTMSDPELSLSNLASPIRLDRSGTSSSESDAPKML